MKAAVFSRYGPPEVVQIRSVEKPVPRDHEVLIQVRAASLNPLDWHILRGKPYILRLMGGLRAPKDSRCGRDVAGSVIAVGRNVTQFKVGDGVFGECRGAVAEFACAAESALALKPDTVTFEQSAAVPIAAFTALQSLRDKGHIQPGHQVLINGAAGGVGTFAVQIAKGFGAKVTGVCSTSNVDLVRSLGAEVMDYTREDFTQSARRFDLLLDCVGNRSLLACRRVLNPQGTYVTITGPDGLWLGPLARFLSTLVVSRFVSQNLVPVIANPNPPDLQLLRELLASGKLVPVIDKIYPLSEVPEAIRYLEAGHARGKVLIRLE